MIKPKILKNEAKRIAVLRSYKILDTMEESDYDFLTKMAAMICGTKISLISLIDTDRQWFLSHHGIDFRQTPKEYSFCAHSITHPDTPLIIQDARLDKRFHDNPLVNKSPNMIFYAGFPLISQEGLPLGTLCAIDDKPNQLNTEQIDSLKALAAQVMNILELRRERNKSNNQSKQFENYFEHNLDLLLIADARGNFVKVNQEWEKLFGYGVAELVGTKVLDLIHPSDLEITRKAISKLNKLNKIKNLISRFRTKSGSYRSLEWQANPDENTEL